MKKVLGISIGSSKRNHKAEFELLGEKISLERIGTDGDMKKAIALIEEYDGKVDAFGMGGIDIDLNAYGKRKYVLRAALPMLRAAKQTPMADGTALKHTLERRLARYLNDDLNIPMKGAKVFVTCALDRFGMTEGFLDAGADVICGDFMFTLELPIPLRKKQLDRLAGILFPIISRLPFSMLYPTGEKQHIRKPKYVKYYQWADIIAGDFLYVIRNMPERMDGKIVVTNTVTPADLEELRGKGVKMVITSTPSLGGRSFGTNVIEAACLAVLGKKRGELTIEEYDALLDKLGTLHSCVVLN